MMQYRPLGQSGLSVSVVGFGTAHFRMLPEQKALDVLKLGFSLGVNLVHAAPDYEGSMDLVAEAVRQAGTQITVCSQGHGGIDHFEWLFEKTRRELGKNCLNLFGIACIDDREMAGEDVWGRNGQVKFLKRKKEEGRLRAIFCTTHGSSTYIRRLIESQAFDAVMVAYNPLGFHLLSYNQKDKPEAFKEDLTSNEALFETAKRHKVGLLVMKALAGGLLTEGRAFARRVRLPSDSDVSTAGDLIRYILTSRPEVTCVVAGTASVDEARENAMAGHGPLELSDNTRQELENRLPRLRSLLCSRCGQCDATCSRHLPVSWLFRDAYIKSVGSMPFETLDRLQYDVLHPWARLACSDCTRRTCVCPAGLQVPVALNWVHSALGDLRQRGLMPILCRPALDSRPPDGHAGRLFMTDIPDRLEPGKSAVFRLIFENMGQAAWKPYPSGGEGVHLCVSVAGVVQNPIGLRGEISPGQKAHFSFEIETPHTPGLHLIEFRLIEGSDRVLVRSTLSVDDAGRPQLADTDETRHVNQYSKSTVPSYLCPRFAAEYLRWSLAGEDSKGTIHGHLVVRNTGTQAWWKQATGGVRVTLVCSIDGQWCATQDLPRQIVDCGEEATIGFSFRRPSPTEHHTLTLGLCAENVSLFEDLGIPSVAIPLDPDADADRLEPLVGNGTPHPRYGVRFVEFSIPEKVRRGERLFCSVQIENTGSMTWRSDAQEDGTRVDLVAIVDASSPVTARLGSARVRPGEKTVCYLTIPSPEAPGPHELRLDLVHHDITFFSHEGCPSPCRQFDVQEGPVGAENELYERAMRVNAWFYRPTDGIDGTGGEFPVFIEKAKGCYVWSVGGRRFIDYTMGWGAALLGYNNDRIREAVVGAMSWGGTIPLPHRSLIEVSEMLSEDIPCAERVVFGKNGSDVCSLAVRLARLQTGRQKVLVCGYHGWQDWYASMLGFARSGVPDPARQLVFPFKFNDYENFKALLDEHRGEVAAVMLEPAGPAEDLQGPRQDASREFLTRVADECRRAGALLVFDEIITGFRYRQGSAQKAMGITPDLACLGKALGAGFPIAALVGSAEVVGDCIPSAFYGPTYKDETWSLAAAKEALAIYRSEPVADTVAWIGEAIIRESNSVCASLGLPALMMGPPFRFGMIFDEADPLRLLQLRTLYQQEMLKGGIITYNGVMLPSYAHSDVIEATQAVIRKALHKVDEALRGGLLSQLLEIPLIRP